MMIPIPRGGILRGVDGIDEARAVPGIEDVVISIRAGEAVVPLPEGASYLGFIFARGESPAAVEAALRRAHARLAFDIARAASGQLRYRRPRDGLDRAAASVAGGVAAQRGAAATDRSAAPRFGRGRRCDARRCRWHQT